MKRTTSSIKGVIRESYYSSRVRLAESQSGVPDGMMRVTGVAAVIGVKNRNNRTYTEDNYTYWIDQLQPVIKAGKLFGELEHPDSDNINMNNVSHKIEALWYDKKTKTVYITLLLLDTEKGKIAQSVIKSGGTISVSSRANGSVNNMGYAQIDDLITYDIVGTPGFKESELNLSENYVKFGVSKIKECLMFATADQAKKNSLSLCEALGSNNTYSKYHIINYTDMATNKKMRIRESNIRKVKAALRERRAASRKIGLNEAQSAQLINFLTESFAPLFIGYLSKNGLVNLTESKANSIKSFGQYARKFLFENVEMGQEVLDKVDSPLEEEELEKLEESLKSTKRALREARKQLREAEEDDLDEEEKEELRDEIEKLEDKVEEIQDKIDEACSDDQNEEEEEEEDINESVNSLKTRIARKQKYLTEARKRLREADEDEKEEIEDAIEDLKDEIKELEDKVNESRISKPRKRVNEACDIEEEDCMDCELTNEDIETMSDDELQSYLDANENKASTDECGFTGTPDMYEEGEENPEEVREEEEPMTPGAAEELMDSEENPEEVHEEVESPFMEEEEENPEEVHEEVESPFMTEAKKSMKKQSRLVESIRKRYTLGGKKKPRK